MFQAARETGALQAAKNKLEKQVEDLTLRLQLEKRLRVNDYYFDSASCYLQYFYCGQLENFLHYVKHTNQFELTVVVQSVSSVTTLILNIVVQSVSSDEKILFLHTYAHYLVSFLAKLLKSLLTNAD